jgi:predicted nucleic acid-binding protein
LIENKRHLLDVNVLIALLSEDHIHHQMAKKWFATPALQWAISPFSEAGLLRYMTRPATGGYSVEQITTMLAKFAQLPGYSYQTVDADWRTLTRPFAKQVFGHNQITDAYLLGIAIREGLVLVTFDKAIIHMAGEYSQHVLLLDAKHS